MYVCVLFVRVLCIFGLYTHALIQFITFVYIYININRKFTFSVYYANACLRLCFCVFLCVIAFVPPSNFFKL